jgi:hypothetical protein
MKQTLLTFAILLSLNPHALAQNKTNGEPITFETYVRPILKAHCFECHGDAAKPKGKLDVRLARLLIGGGKSGAAVVPGKLGEGELLDRVRSGEMPPGKRKLTKDEITTIERWIASGAKTERPEPAEFAAGFQITPEEQAFWAFQPIRRVQPPRHDGMPAAIDAFLFAKLNSKGLKFAPEADRRTLIRRLSFDLLGLPPTPQEVDAFVNDKTADAYEKLVDRLLASPHYGERWGRHWLDVAGYADSEGYASDDAIRSSSYRYRDYVIRAFHEDKPYDQFIIEQLAGDELVKPPYDKISKSDLDKLIATGFLRMAPDGTGSKEVDMKVATNQTIADTMQIVSTSILGLTMHCAQCHNHRYDPIPQVDYYRMRAIFEPALDWKNWRAPAAREVVVLSDAERAKAAAIEKEAVKVDQERLQKQSEYIEQTFKKELAKLPAAIQDAARIARDTTAAKRNAAQKKLMSDYPSLNVSPGSLYLYDSKAAADLLTYTKKAAAIRATKPTGDSIRALTEIPGKIPTTHRFERGDHDQPKETVVPAQLTVLHSLNLKPIPARDPTLPSSGRRLAFTRSLVDGKHPLTARVFVNRLWLHHFGKGIVNTPGDFGFLGERPSHPELLDWLASDFMAGGWKIKRMHKLMLTSQAYRQSSTRDAKLVDIDPENRLLGRMPVRRLDAEAVRDAILVVSGKLSTKQFGPPVPIAFDELGQVVVGVDTTDAAGRPTKKVVSLNGDEYRRSLYVQVRRSRPLGVLETFDAASVSPNCEIRNSSTVTPQSLLMMNSRFIHEQAELFAKRVQKEGGKDARAQITLAWRLAFGSEPTAKDVDDAATFISEQTIVFREQPDRAEPELRALASFCQALLSANRFLYVD